LCSSLQPLSQWALAHPLALSLISLLYSPSLRFSFSLRTSSSSVYAVSVTVFLEIFGAFLEFFFVVIVVSRVVEFCCIVGRLVRVWRSSLLIFVASVDGDLQ
jgi:hypothetical protein